MKITRLFSLAIAGLLATSSSQLANALPPPEDTPEEVLRTEIILEARSPLTGEPLTAAEYDQLQETLGRNEDPLLPSQVRELVFLLQLRRVVKPLLPFL
ncbi:MAG: hypothetical protein F6J95_028545 [Leptolyngbya sp. SIO1E4]|nr:hypothetical protein [Leptolyngbya sp. SIO1E4]